MKSLKYIPWTKYPQYDHIAIWSYLEQLPNDFEQNKMLAFGKGSSYGDVCLNQNGILFDTNALSSIFEFDRVTGILRCGSGTTIKQILNKITPVHWFLPVVPGTKNVSVGGAIANDIHGKNHHVKGSFGNHIVSLEIYRTDVGLVECSNDKNSALFHATIGGIGLTGLIITATIQLIRIPSQFLDIENKPFGSIKEFIDLTTKVDSEYEYTVGWLNSTGTTGSGILQLANFCDIPKYNKNNRIIKERNIPSFLAKSCKVNRILVKIINRIYNIRMITNNGVRHFNDYLFPLDFITDWNKFLPSSGFIQYQCRIPYDNASDIITKLLELAFSAKTVSFLNVIKIFGLVEPNGFMSFPRQGVTLSIDFFKINAKTLEILDIMDNIVFNCGGAIYPAKDFRMNPKYFRRNFLHLEQFVPHIDPNFSSSYWRRMNE